jgi:hypothetical protein
MSYRRLVFFLALATACSSPGANADANAEPEADAEDPTMLWASDVVETGMYRTSIKFRHVTAQRFASGAAKGSTIDLWITSSSEAAYAKIDPAQGGSRVKLARGAVIVREVVDANGDVKSATLMFKGQKGYNPALGDWGFGTIDASGKLKMGALKECFACHDARGSDDYLFGVPPESRSAGGGAGTADGGASVHARSE